MEIQEKILTYLSVYGKENKYRLARALKIDVSNVTKALSKLREEGNIDIKSGNAVLVKGKKSITIKAKKRKKPKVEAKEEQPKEEPEEEQPKTEKEKPEKVEEKPEEAKEEPTEEEGKEEEKPEEVIEEEKIKGTVKFYNPNKGFGFITGDDGKDYYVHESSLKEGVTIEADDRVSFKAAEGDKGPKAEEVEKISQTAEYIQ